MIAGFISANSDLLAQLQQVLTKVSGEQYAAHHAEIFDASLGGHVRHLLDHYENLLAAVLQNYPADSETLSLVREKPLINYDSRPRERSIEIDQAKALERIVQIRQTLDHMPRANIDVDIILQIDSAPESALQHSTLARELSFLHSHSVHHLAMISFMLRAMGLNDIPHDFGIAPSTVKVREAM